MTCFTAILSFVVVRYREQVFVGPNNTSGERRPDDTRGLFPRHRNSSSAVSAFLFVAHVQPGAAGKMSARSYNGSGNNLDNPLWGSANYTQALDFFAVLYGFSCLRVYGVEAVS